MWLRYVLCGFFCLGLAEGFSAVTAPELASALTKRYAPDADWQRVIDVDVLAKQIQSRYWQTPEEIISRRVEGDLPLSGLHLAIDPGHVGGQWAADEGRNFRISEGDFYVREGELVLEVAQRAREQLVQLGAKVSLLREASVQVNSKTPVDYLGEAAEQLKLEDELSVEALWACDRVRDRAVHLSVISGELAARARLVNEEIRPDALISLHINAAVWPQAAPAPAASAPAASAPAASAPAASESESAPAASESAPAASESESAPAASESAPAASEGGLQLVETNNLHALIFGCMSAGELGLEGQLEQLAVKLTNDSGEPERLLGNALVAALADASDLPAAKYEGRNAILVNSEQPYLFARNLLLLRRVECPVVLLEPYVANSTAVYPRIQSALATRAAGRALSDNDILAEYADAVVAGVLACYQ